MFASPRSAKQVRTPSCVKDLTRTSNTRGLVSLFIERLSPGAAESQQRSAKVTREAAAAFVHHLVMVPGEHRRKNGSEDIHPCLAGGYGPRVLRGGPAGERTQVPAA